MAFRVQGLRMNTQKIEPYLSSFPDNVTVCWLQGFQNLLSYCNRSSCLLHTVLKKHHVKIQLFGSLITYYKFGKPSNTSNLDGAMNKMAKDPTS